MSGRTFYIVPAWSGQAGQCRIVARDGFIKSAGESYRDAPEQWVDCGIMNSQGRLVCLEGSTYETKELRDMEPLMAGVAVYCEGAGS